MMYIEKGIQVVGGITFISPRQGAQCCGVGKDFYRQTGVDRKILDRASEFSSSSMPELCFTENDRLGITEHTQAAMVTISITMVDVLEEHGVKPDVTAGPSLGKYCALAAASVIPEGDATTTAKQGEILMQEAVPAGVGATTTILALDAAKAEKVFGEIEDVQIANYNCLGQIIISRKIEVVERANEAPLAEGAKRIITLNISDSFHSDILQGAGKKLGAVLEGVEIHQPATPYMADVTAPYMASTDKVKPFLEEQVPSSVRWQQNVETMIADDAGTFIKIGPGRTLAGFIKKINRDVKVFSIEKPEDVKKVIKQFK